MKRNKTFHPAMAIFLIPLCLLLLGCPKKAPSPDSGKAAITAKTQPLAPSPGRLGGEPLSPGAGREPSGEADRLAAIRGEDVPLSPAKGTFKEPSGTERELFKPVYFDYDKSDIRPEFRPGLDAIGEWMKRNAGRQLLVEGHCDERGTNEYNLALGERRALSVRRYLVALGVGSERIATISYGEEKPADPGHGEEAWAKNRRAEFKLSAD